MPQSAAEEARTVSEHVNHPGPDDPVLQQEFIAENAGYHKGLSKRQIQMIGIGGAIGTGLFLGAGGRLHTAGPGLVLVYPPGPGSHGRSPSPDRCAAASGPFVRGPGGRTTPPPSRGRSPPTASSTPRRQAPVVARPGR
nr:hypothetical protein [Nakamurella multipartita]